ncbi:hypothetical protein QWZ00_17505 [Belliella kenyensis]|nr:hypothetical protein [Belliella kenyensis]MDN3604867.1 hypothetical protein [Belliella kenyensis]MDN3604914.1 hypothetical protein [Belliella kenyensis]
MIDKKISEEYEKYIICFQFSGSKLYTAYGPDLNSDGGDKFLVDENFNILLFRSCDYINKYIQKNSENANLFDAERLIKWAHLNDDFSCQASYDLDSVASLIRSTEIKYEYFEANIRCLLDFINLFKDYYYQINDNTFDKILGNSNLNTFLDFAYDGYPWKSNFNSLEQKYEAFVNQVNNQGVLFDTMKMYDYFIKRFRIISE